MNALPAASASPEAAAMRRGACPALSAPMRTGDGLLVRLNLAEGGLSPTTLSALCEAAAIHGNGLVEITARGSFQVRGLTPASAPRFAATVNSLDIPVREGVPVETSPLAGLDPGETADPLPLLRAIRTAIASAGLSARLGPKVSVVVDGGGQVSLGEMAADVRVEAVSPEEWAVSVAHRPAARHTGEAEAAATVMALLERIATLGIAARGRDLIAAGGGGFTPHKGVGRAAAPGMLPLRDNLSALAVALPFGQCQAASLAELATSTPGIAGFRFAPGRRLLALGRDRACAALRDKAAALGFVTEPADPRLRVAACPGAPACASGHFDAKALGARVAGALPERFAGTVHVSGCAKGCAHPAPADFVLGGSAFGVALVRAGRAADAPSSLHPDVETGLAALVAELQKAPA